MLSGVFSFAGLPPSQTRETKIAIKEVVMYLNILITHS
jgi:hypothetical protein